VAFIEGAKMEIPRERRMVEGLLVRAMLEADEGHLEAANDFATVALMMLDPIREGELVEQARRVLWQAGAGGVRSSSSAG
jgi:hypothetical protein